MDKVIEELAAKANKPRRWWHRREQKLVDAELMGARRARESVIVLQLTPFEHSIIQRACKRQGVAGGHIYADHA